MMQIRERGMRESPRQRAHCPVHMAVASGKADAIESEREVPGSRAKQPGAWGKGLGRGVAGPGRTTMIREERPGGGRGAAAG